MITVGFITATDRDASKTLALCECVCILTGPLLKWHLRTVLCLGWNKQNVCTRTCVCVCPRACVCVCVWRFDKLFTSLRKQRQHCLCLHLLLSVFKRWFMCYGCTGVQQLLVYSLLGHWCWLQNAEDSEAAEWEESEIIQLNWMNLVSRELLKQFVCSFHSNDLLYTVQEGRGQPCTLQRKSHLTSH